MNLVIRQIIEIMRRVHGEDISVYDSGFLTLALKQRIQSLDSVPLHRYAAYLAASGNEASELLDALHVDYSEFFRDSLAISVLEHMVLPLLMTASAPAGAGLRIWSAGCAQGQEPYSIAILLDGLNAARQCPTPYRVFATDICEVALTTARYGTYARDELRNVPMKHLRRCFVPTGADYRICSQIADRTDFSIFDLTDPLLACPPSSIYGGFDLVSCSNVLLYYRAELRRQIVDKLHHTLLPQGFLVTGSVEREIVEAHGGFQAVAPPAPVFQKRHATRTTQQDDR